jgi:hypothetical protein
LKLSVELGVGLPSLSRMGSMAGPAAGAPLFSPLDPLTGSLACSLAGPAPKQSGLAGTSAGLSSNVVLRLVAVAACVVQLDAPLKSSGAGLMEAKCGCAAVLVKIF